MENFFKSGMDFFLEVGRGDLFWDLSLQEAGGIFWWVLILALFPSSPSLLIQTTLFTGFVLSFMASSVGKLSSLIGHSSVPFYNHPQSPCIHD